MRVLIALFITMLTCNISYSAELFASVDAFYGRATVTDKSGQSIDVSLGQKINEGQTIKTASDGEVHLVTQDSGLIALRPNTEFRVDEYKAEGGSADKVFMSLFKGAVRSITGWIGKHNTSSYRITTPNGTIGIRGTDHETTVIVQEGVDEPGTYDTVIEGATVIKTAKGSTNIFPGSFAFAPQGKTVAPYLLTKVPKYWTMRSLKIEDRIQKRKEFLRDHLEQMRSDRISEIRSKNAAHSERLHEHHEHAHKMENKY
jgi:hypothetical protein